MEENLRQSIRSIGRFSDEQLHEIGEVFKSATYRKGEHLLEEGEVCSAYWFIRSGSVHQYHLNANHDQVTTGLFVAGQWVLDPISFTGRKASSDCLEAFEDTQTFQMTIHQVHELIARSQVYFQLGKILEWVGRRPFTKEQGPDERYLKLLESTPEILQCFPLKYIASYLEMTPETLSRVRKRISSRS